jgi:hypothetical protein
MSTMTLDRPLDRRIPSDLDAMLRPVAAVAPRTRVRLTRRGRLVVFLASLFLAFVVGMLIAAGSVATQEPGTPEPTRVMTVGTGDTLWGISTELAGDGDTRDMMRRIESLNALESGMLTAGQRLVVPAD